jgi:hypothetical protein
MSCYLFIDLKRFKEGDDMFFFLIHDFISLKKRNLVRGEDGLKTVEVTNAADESLKTHEPISI